MGHTRTVLAVAAIFLAGASPVLADQHHGRPGRPRDIYRQTNLVSDIAGVALNTDPNLVNPWGLAINPTGPFWVANNGTGTSTLYDGEGNPFPPASPLVVDIQSAGSPPADNGPVTGTIANTTSDFVISAGGKSGPARFLFAGEDGVISGWNPAVNPTQAIQVLDLSGAEAIYKGLAMGMTPTGNRIFATNFHEGAVDVFDSHFQMIMDPGAFTDPSLPAGYGPFGIANIGGNLLVTYAKQDDDKEDDVAGAGFGYADMYDTSGHLLRRFASNGALNAPWGMVMAPRKFGRFGGALLIGNFGDGRINAFDPRSGAYLGAITDFRGRPITIDGLWGLSFGNGVRADDNALFFTAGIADESHGLFGVIEAVHQDDFGTHD